jgi:cellulose synthase/poly-beta-1,6-N-acetylglucosamine synthase-like glycosyltransferase
MTQSSFTKACGLYYIFDSRCGSRVRERLHIDAHVNGPGSLIDMDIIRRIGGYDTVTMCEDTEFNFKRMFEGYKPHFVEEAVVYEDLPSTFKDTLARNKRLGAGNLRMLFRYGPKMFFYAIKNFNFSYIEAFLNYLFIPICPILCIWLPGYYIYAYIYHFMGFMGPDTIAAANLAAGKGMEPIAGIFPVSDPTQWCVTYAWVIVFCIGVLFAFCGILQGVIMVLSDYKKMGAKRRRDLISGVLLFPFFSIIYVITITIGVFSKPKWTKVRRNPIKKEEQIESN